VRSRVYVITQVAVEPTVAIAVLTALNTVFVLLLLSGKLAEWLEEI
jgi:hypothetical protein